MQKISETNLTDEIYAMLPLEISPMPTLSLEDSLARLFQSQENEQGSVWMTPEGLSLLKCLDSLGIKPYRTSFLRMSKVSSTTTEDAPSKSSSKSWMAWGMTANGSCLTAKISVSHNTENACSLSQILEENPDQKYFLSEEQVERMMNRKRKNEQEGRGFSPTFLQRSMPTTPKEERLDNM